MVQKQRDAKTVDVAQYIDHKDVKLKQILILLNLNVCKLEKSWFECSLGFYVSELVKTTAVWNIAIKKRLWKLLIEFSVVDASLARIRLSKS